MTMGTAAEVCASDNNVLMQERLSDMEDNTRQLPTLQSVQHSRSQSRIGSVPGNHSPDVTVNTPLLDPEGLHQHPVLPKQAHQRVSSCTRESVDTQDLLVQCILERGKHRAFWHLQSDISPLL